MQYRFGDKLRSIREKRKLTMREIAEQAGISESMVSQIERNKVSPAVDTLFKLADILDIEFEFLFADVRKERAVRIVRVEDRSKMTMSGVRYEQLAAAGLDEEHGLEAWLIEIAPGATRGDSEYGHPGRELGIVLEGQLEFHLGNRIHVLESGDSLSFESSVPHQLVNRGTVPMKAYWIVTPPKGRD